MKLIWELPCLPTTGTTCGLWDLIFQDALEWDPSNTTRNFLTYRITWTWTRYTSLDGKDTGFRSGLWTCKNYWFDFCSSTQAELALVSTEKDKGINAAINQGYVLVDWGASFHITHAKNFMPTQPPVLHTTLAKIALEFILHHGGSAHLPLRLIKHHLQTRLYRVETLQ